MNDLSRASVTISPRWPPWEIIQIRRNRESHYLQHGTVLQSSLRPPFRRPSAVILLLRGLLGPVRRPKETGSRCQAWAALAGRKGSGFVVGVSSNVRLLDRASSGFPRFLLAEDRGRASGRPECGDVRQCSLFETRRPEGFSLWHFVFFFSGPGCHENEEPRPIGASLSFRRIADFSRVLLLMTTQFPRSWDKVDRAVWGLSAAPATLRRWK